MKNYEKKSLYSFITIFFLGFMAIFLLLASLFYLVEEKRLSSEERMKQHIEFVECKTIYGDSKECQKYLKTPMINLQATYEQIFYAFLLSLLIVIPTIITLGYISLKPVRRATALLDSVMEQITHDMNTPMSAIKINASSIMKKTDGVIQNKAHRIVESAKQIELMQGNLQALILREQRALYSEKLDLSLLINGVIATLQTKYQNSIINYDSIPLEIYADKTDIQRVLINIIENSIKYNKNNNPIKIFTLENTIHIQDKGIGIKDISKVFDNYYRESSSKQGLGIGLSATYQLCLNNNCKIKIESEFGVGTTVILSFNDGDSNV
ncbi:MAG: HAMP domain-containing sensor histidine kinase [Campylobacterota bacterium]|nr:HAMP domain-containing sensor histidine kinase [Campylobacterota bacterium]